MEGQNCWDRCVCVWKLNLDWFSQEADRYLSSLVRESECIPQVGWRVCVGWSLVAHSLMGGKQTVPNQMGASSLSGGGSF